MRKTVRFNTNRHFMSDMKLVDKALQVLATKVSKRTAAMMLHTDLSQFRIHFHFPSLKITQEFSNKVCEDVIKKKLGYHSIVKKYGKKGLEAIYVAKSLEKITHSARVQNALNVYRFKTTEEPKSISEIARLLGVSRNVVSNNVMDMGKTGVIHIRSWKHTQSKLHAVKLFKSGITSIPEIARLIGFSIGGTRTLLEEGGISLKYTSKYDESTITLAGRLRARGLKWQEIAEIVQLPLVGLKSAYINYMGTIKNQEVINNGK